MRYAIQVTTRQEENTISLCRAIIDPAILSDIYFPQAETMRKYQGEWVKRQSPLFPGYLFADTDEPDELRSLFHRVPKLTRLLGAGAEPIPLTDQETEWLDKILNPVHVVEFSTGIIIGDRLSVERGALKGMEGLVIHIDRHKRTAVLEVEMFGRKVRTTLGLEVVRKV